MVDAQVFTAVYKRQILYIHNPDHLLDGDGSEIGTTSDSMPAH